jgi:hypothetical protein
MNTANPHGTDPMDGYLRGWLKSGVAAKLPPDGGRTHLLQAAEAAIHTRLRPSGAPRRSPSLHRRENYDWPLGVVWQSAFAFSTVDLRLFGLKL